MKRRDFLSAGVATSVAAAAAGLPRPAIAQGIKELKMVTTWPKNMPGLGVAAERLAKRIQEMSGGRLVVKVYAAGELVPALESFDAVSRGAADMAHGAAYYWQGKSKAFNFFTGVPFGMTAAEISAWVRYMGGQELWDELTAQFGCRSFMAGQTGTQAAGWFRKELTGLADVKGLKFRTPGLGGEVWKKLGVTVVNLPAGEIFPNLQSGALDAAEFVGPHTDIALGLWKVAKNYYWPSFNEPGLALELTVNNKVYEGLPADLQAIIRYACQADYEETYAELRADDARALDKLVNEHGVKVLELPSEIMAAGANAAGEVLAELREAGDPMTKKVIESYLAAYHKLKVMTSLADRAFLEVRKLPVKYG